MNSREQGRNFWLSFYFDFSMSHNPSSWFLWQLGLTIYFWRKDQWQLQQPLFMEVPETNQFNESWVDVLCLAPAFLFISLWLLKSSTIHYIHMGNTFVPSTLCFILFLFRSEIMFLVYKTIVFYVAFLYILRCVHHLKSNICGDNVVTNMCHEGEEKQLQWNVSSAMIL